MRLRILRSFESLSVAASSKSVQALPAIYQFHPRGVVSQVRFGSAILNGFRGTPVFQAEDPLPRRLKKYRAQETKDKHETAGKVIISPRFPEPSADPMRTNA